MSALSGSQLYDTRACLALALSVMQGWRNEDACRFAGTKATAGQLHHGRPQFSAGQSVIWRDKYLRTTPAEVLAVNDRIQIRAFTPGGARILWVTANRLELPITKP